MVIEFFPEDPWIAGRAMQRMGISRQAAMAYVDEEAGGDEAFELSAS